MKAETRLRFFSSEDQKWATPKRIFNRFDAVFRFKLDPCCVPKTAKCATYFTPETDGLKQDWHKVGNTFVNPPFSRELPLWIKKSFDESQKGIIVAMLIPARPDTQAWQTYCLPYAKILFIKGRITFEDQRDKPMEKLNPAFFPSALVVFGNTKDWQLENLEDLGVWLIKLSEVKVADGTPTTNDGIPPNNKLSGILPNEL